MSEYADYLIREAEKRQTNKVTPYDADLLESEHARELMVLLLGHVRHVVHEYTKNHSDWGKLSDALLMAEDVFADAFDEVQAKIKREIEAYNASEEDACNRADAILDERD